MGALPWDVGYQTSWHIHGKWSGIYNETKACVLELLEQNFDLTAHADLTTRLIAMDSALTCRIAQRIM